MSIISCMMQKYQQQKNEFAGKPYESLSPQEKLNILNTKNGYLRPSHVTQIESLIQSHMATGMSEKDAALFVHESIEQALQKSSLRTVATQASVQNFVQDFDSAIAKGVPIKVMASELFAPSTGRNIRYGDAKTGAILNNVMPYSQSLNTARSMAVRHLQPLVDSMPPSILRGIRDADGELGVMKAVFGDRSDPKFAKLADDLKAFGDAINADLQSVNGRTINTDRVFGGLFPRGDKIRNSIFKKGNQEFTDFMSRPDLLKWDEVQKAKPGQYLDSTSKADILKRSIQQVVSEGALDDKEAGDVLSLLRFNKAEDAVEFNSRFGQGGLLNTLNTVTQNYAREFAWGKLTGGDAEAWKAGILDHVARAVPDQVGEFKKKLDTAVTNHQISFAGDVDGLVRQGGDLLKDLTVAQHMGYSGVAAVLHYPMVLVRAAQEGLSGTQIALGGYGKLIQSMFDRKGFNEWQSRLAQAGVNSDTTLRIMNKAIDENNGNPVTRMFRQSANAVINASGLPGATSVTRAQASSVIRQDIARVIASGQSVQSSGMKGLFHVGINDADLKFIKENGFYTNTDNPSGVNDLDISKLWNSGSQGQDVAIKIHHLMDNIGLAGAPHSNEAWHQQLNGLRKSGTLGNMLASVVGPLTGYLAASTTEVILPALMQPTLAGAIGWTAASLVAMEQLGMINVQLKRLQDGKDMLPFDSMSLHAQAISRVGLGAQLMNFTADLGTNSRADGNFIQRSLPTVKTFEHIYGLAQHEAEALFKGTPNTHVTHDTRSALSDWAPGGSFPLMSMIMDRFITGPLYHSIDPDSVNRSNEFKKQYAQKERSGYWIKPGEQTIDHNPLTGK